MMRSRRAWLAPFLAVALITAACGGGDDAADEVSEATDEGDAGDAEPTEDATQPGADGEEMMAPVRGGSLTYLLEAETDTWNIPNANCAAACIIVMRQVMDPLTIVNENGDVEPFLLESFEASDDFTEHTLTLRDGIMFHDGTPADGAAMQRSLQEMAKGILQGQFLVDLVGGPDGIELVDPMTVKLTFARPFATFPYFIAERTGWLIAPSYWDNPDRAGALAVGTGPFKMVEWTRDEQTVLEANPDYWRTNPNGEPLPYLDSIVFRPMPDGSARRAVMEAGDADANHDSLGENVDYWNTDWLASGGQLVDPAPDRETNYLMFNNSAPPFDDPDMRRALAMCTDREEYLVFRTPDSQLVNGPFAAGSLGYLDDTGVPEFDPEAGNALLDQIGRPEEITYGAPSDPSLLLTAELFADMWSTNCGLSVNIDQFDQSQFITKMITGAFQVVYMRNHGQGHPGLEFVWWHSRHAEGLALNFSRIIDPEMDSLLEQTWATTDAAELDELGKQINQVLGANVYGLWLNTIEWAIPFGPDVHGVGVMHLPSGNLGQPAIAGRTWLHEAWREG